MSSRLNPRDYDLGELRDAVRESPRDGDEGPEKGPGDGRSGDLSAIADLLHEDPGAGTEPEGNGDPRSDEDPPVRPESGEETVERSGDRSADDRDRRSADDRADRPGGGRDDDRRGGRSVPASSSGRSRASAGRMRRNPARFARSASRDRTPDGRPRRRGEGGDGESPERSVSSVAGSSGRAGAADRDRGSGVGGFELLAAGSGDLERPYLDRLPEGYRAQLEIFEWLEGLLGTCGWEATADALAYYDSIGWLSEGAREDLEGFLEGLSATEPSNPRPPGVDDHLESLRYVARLAGRVDR